ncbi:hypothetical protein M2447_000144 [Ereboglobus sp. PH5-10]|uniref:hypothetical protein n=1 Tax=Ereboglobus sp. PH5-10 TaxID=2940629 RepID=UPI0024061816|nr:hypothetical protein [Ereboglobus sp. PH5-10]MDF9826068.1 hypothetical protein [Ereboglobus sp. PH5-10]
MLLCPKALFRALESAILLLITVDVALLGMLFAIFFDWRKKKASGLVLLSLTVVLISHVLLPPLEGSVFYIVAVAPIAVFIGSSLVSFTLKMKVPPSQSGLTQKNDDSAI